VPQILDVGFRERTHLGPIFVNARERARALVARGRLDEARAVLLTAIRSDPDDPATLTDLGTVLVRCGLRDAARTAYERAVQLAPGCPATSRRRWPGSRSPPTPQVPPQPARPPR